MSRSDLPPEWGLAEGDHEEPDWVFVATADDQLMAEMWQQVLEEEQIPSMLAPDDAVSFLGVSAAPVRLMVPADMVDRARYALSTLRDRPPAGPDGEEISGD